MNLLDRFRAWLNRDMTEATNRMSLAFQDAFERQREAIAHNSNLLTNLAAGCNSLDHHQQDCHSELVAVIVKMANSCASLEQALTDRLDIIEGRLDELKPGQPAAVSSAGGHKRWTDRRDERVSKHFNRDEFVRNLQKAGTNGE
jgi:di/tripeptidase